MDLIRRKILATGAVATAMAAVRSVFAQQPGVAFENCVDAFPSSQRRGGAKRRGGQFGEIQDVPV